jgi:hypothetical protein
MLEDGTVDVLECLWLSGKTYVLAHLVSTDVATLARGTAVWELYKSTYLVDQQEEKPKKHRRRDFYQSRCTSTDSTPTDSTESEESPSDTEDAPAPKPVAKKSKKNAQPKTKKAGVRSSRKRSRATESGSGDKRHSGVRGGVLSSGPAAAVPAGWEIRMDGALSLLLGRQVLGVPFAHKQLVALCGPKEQECLQDVFDHFADTEPSEMDNVFVEIVVGICRAHQCGGA